MIGNRTAKQNISKSLSAHFEKAHRFQYNEVNQKKEHNTAKAQWPVPCPIHRRENQKGSNLFNVTFCNSCFQSLC